MAKANMKSNVSLISKSLGRTLLGLFILLSIVSIQALLGILVLYICVKKIGRLYLAPYEDSGQETRYTVHAEFHKNGFFAAFGAMFMFVLWVVFGLKLHVISLEALRLLAGDDLRDTIQNE